LADILGEFSSDDGSFAREMADFQNIGATYNESAAPEEEEKPLEGGLSA
jgi:hypothetical protein